MKHPNIAEKIIQLKNDDLSFRNKLIQDGILEQGYHPEMEAIHIRNAEQLEEIINSIGYPTISKVGKEASQAAWLIIQHAISLPSFMKKCADHLDLAVKEEDADPKQLAYLTDRIAIFEGRPQKYGTAFDWDANGELSPQLYDDAKLVDARRQKLDMNTLAEQTKVIREQAKKENQSPPKNLAERSEQYYQWRKAVGWII